MKIPADSTPYSDLEVPVGWVNVSSDLELRLCKISHQDFSDCAPLVITRSLIVKPDNSWILHVHDRRVNHHHIPSISDIPSCLDHDSLNLLLLKVCALNTCIGNPETKFTELGKSKKNGNFLSSDKNIVACLEYGYVTTVGGEKFPSTVRCSDCHLLTESQRCCACTSYRNTLFAASSRVGKNSQTVKHKTTNYRQVY